MKDSIFIKQTEKICEYLASTEWKSYLEGDDVEKIWQKIKEEKCNCVMT